MTKNCQKNPSKRGKNTNKPDPRGRFFAFACVVLLVAVAGCEQGPVPGSTTGNETQSTVQDDPTSTSVSTSIAPRPTDDYNTATVKYVVDGDTLRLTDGDYVRLIGVDAPETDEYFYEEAKAALEELVAGGEVELVKDVSETDKYGRLLRYVYVDDVFVNAELARQGAARSRRYEPDSAMYQFLEDAEDEARAARRGIYYDLPASTTVTLPDVECDRYVYSCRDFDSQEEAQLVFDSCGGVDNDVHHLDRDRDGVACEDLPAT